jgi:hypothetical protein
MQQLAGVLAATTDDMTSAKPITLLPVARQKHPRSRQSMARHYIKILELRPSRPPTDLPQGPISRRPPRYLTSPIASDLHSARINS